MQTFGCERCGRHGTALQPLALRCSGNLLASATVHLHADKRRSVPFVIGTIALDDGPIIRTLLTSNPPNASHTRVIGTLIPVALGDPAIESLDLRFGFAEDTQ